MLQRILASVIQPSFLFFLTNIQIVFKQLDSGLGEHVFEFRHHLHEFLVLLVGAEAHHTLDAGAVVPASVEENELLRGWQMWDVALEVPAAMLPIGRLSEGHYARLPRTQVPDDPLDHTVLPRSVPAFDQDEDLIVAADEMLLKLDKLDLKCVKNISIVARLCRLLVGRRAIVFRAVLDLLLAHLQTSWRLSSGRCGRASP